ncbi:MAG: GMC family oxidoreductase, partial [Rhodothermia bacterium]
ASLVEAVVPKPFGKLLSMGVKLLTGLLIIAEDQPLYGNRVLVDRAKRDAFGMPTMIVESQYSPRDVAARAALLGKAKQVLKKAGALAVYLHKITTFSHSVGSVRLGDDEATAPLDPDCRFRGVDNLFVVDGSFMPTSAGINPSLTITANALRVSKAVIQQLASSEQRAASSEQQSASSKQQSAIGKQQSASSKQQPGTRNPDSVGASPEPGIRNSKS